MHFRPSAADGCPLADGDVHLWRQHFDELPEPTASRWEAVLDEGERRRLQRIADAGQARRVAASRLLLRTVLAGYLDCEPGEVALDTGANGRPRLADPGSTPLTFNLSHSDGLLVLAVARAETVGVDIERVRQRPRLEALLRRCFSDRERQALAALGDDLAGFYRGWTRKEALVKARDGGVFRGLRQAEVSLGDVLCPPVLCLDGDREAGRRWQLLNFEPEAGAVGAVALPAGSWRLRPLTLEDRHLSS